MKTHTPDRKGKTVTIKEIEILEGSRYGQVIRLDEDNETVWVNYPDNPYKKDLPAKIGNHLISGEDLQNAISKISVVLLDFVDNHPAKPIIRDIFFSFRTDELSETSLTKSEETIHVVADRIILEGKTEIVIQSGDARTIYKARNNQLIEEADEIKSSSRGTHRIRGAKVLVN